MFKRKTTVTPQPEQWEYREMTINTLRGKPVWSQDKMSEIGWDGWELVSVIPYTDGKELKAYFKRRVLFDELGHRILPKSGYHENHPVRRY